jgi:hypothetical protein
MKNAPVLSRILFLAFIWIFAFGGSYVLLDALGLWSSLPPSLTRAVDIATGCVLVGALLAHLVAATGALPAPGGESDS